MTSSPVWLNRGVRAVPALHPALHPAPHPARGAGSTAAKGFSAAPAVHIPGRNQLEEAWKARPFYSPELRLWLAAGTRPKLHLKCFRQPICTGFGSLRSACCGPLFTRARRKQGGKQGVRGWLGRSAQGQQERSRPRTQPVPGCLMPPLGLPPPHGCSPRGPARGSRPLWGPQAAPVLLGSLGSASPAPDHGWSSFPYPPRSLWFFMSTSW